MSFREETKVQIKRVLDLGDNLSKRLEKEQLSSNNFVVLHQYASKKSIECIVNAGLRVVILLQGTPNSLINQAERFRKELPEDIQDKVSLHSFGDMSLEKAEQRLRERVRRNHERI